MRRRKTIFDDGFQNYLTEDINIERGYNLIDKFFPTDRVTEGWSEPKKMTCEREIIRF